MVEKLARFVLKSPVFRPPSASLALFQAFLTPRPRRNRRGVLELAHASPRRAGDSGARPPPVVRAVAARFWTAVPRSIPHSHPPGFQAQAPKSRAAPCKRRGRRPQSGAQPSQSRPRARVLGRGARFSRPQGRVLRARASKSGAQARKSGGKWSKRGSSRPISGFTPGSWRAQAWCGVRWGNGA